MSFTLYKPNKSNKGSLLSFSFTSKGDKKGVFANFVAQNGWDSQARGGEGNGIFKDGKTVTVKFSIFEIGEIINAIERREDANPRGFYHKSQSGSTQIYFKRYKGKVKDGERWVEGPDYTGYSLSALKGEDKFNVPITFGEAAALRIWMENALVHIYDAIYSDEIRRFQEREKERGGNRGVEITHKPKTVEDFVDPSGEDEIPF